MEEEKLLRILKILIFVVISLPAAAQTSDAWLDQLLSLKREGWDKKVSPILPDMTRPVAPVIAFVSFSMPDNSLKAILSQVDRAGGVVVLRGLVNDSFTDTSVIVTQLASEYNVSFNIDPKLFSQYDIVAVPSFVVPDGNRFDKISGNISLTAALEAFVQTGDNPDAARRLLTRLREGSE